MRHAASEGSTGLDWDWLPKKELRKPIGALSALVVAVTCSTVHESMDLATHGEKDPTPVTDRTDNLPQPAVPGDSIDTSTDTDQSSSDRVVVDGAFYESTCQIWRESGQAGKFVCANPNRTFNPGVQPVGGANPDTQFYVNIDSADKSTTA
ncbi:hypothetical protein G1ANC_00078 [Candidatus Nanosynsacchari sp. TM7_ANC_38.39_G1_1]|nr:hypothetical protein G1ANC_00078 [Candidatus Nanosynsacchari sp. TM7_ANC_38.39_G1_1]